MPRKPSLSPYLAPNIICPNCGSVLTPEVVAMGKGKVSDLQYVCVNEKADCGYIFRASLQHIMGEDVPLKQGKPARLLDDGKTVDPGEPGELEKRREEINAAKEFAATRESALRELIAMVPSLKEIVAMLKVVEDDKQKSIGDGQQSNPDTPAQPASPVEGKVTDGTTA